MLLLKDKTAMIDETQETNKEYCKEKEEPAF